MGSIVVYRITAFAVLGNYFQVLNLYFKSHISFFTGQEEPSEEK